jgi:hypothetical protein
VSGFSPLRKDQRKLGTRFLMRISVGVEKDIVRSSSWSLQMAGEQRCHPSLQVRVGRRW